MPVRYDNPRDVGADRIVDARCGGGALRGGHDRGGLWHGDGVRRGVRTGVPGRGHRAGDQPVGGRAVLQHVAVAAGGAGGAAEAGAEHDDVVAVGDRAGDAGLVEAMVGRFKAEIGEDARVVGTGGLVTVISDHVPRVRRHQPGTDAGRAGHHLPEERGGSPAPAHRPA
ncbi:Type III pantothenate kinase [Geodia barretti]|uniref:Type III pantothenate kinase n=2 Tax=Geodia barretti TaxID=519541 RepID=A0AA35WSP6_GEOBA|nr:Type III pantothenate kinase [Geodia barretti]